MPKNRNAKDTIKLFALYDKKEEFFHKHSKRSPNLEIQYLDFCCEYGYETREGKVSQLSLKRIQEIQAACNLKMQNLPKSRLPWLAQRLRRQRNPKM